MENTFIRVRSAQDIVISSLLIIAGIVLVVLPTSTPINIVGFFLLLAGAILFLVLKRAYKKVDTGVKYYKSERYFSQEMHEELKRKVESPAKISSGHEDKGSSLRLDVYYSKEVGRAYAQLFEYVPYKYEPCSKLYEHTYEEGYKLIEK